MSRVYLQVNALCPAYRSVLCPHAHMPYSGSVPCTGARRCTMCGASEYDLLEAMTPEKPKRWRVVFIGRQAGALGVNSRWEREVQAPTVEAAHLALYDTHEHISVLSTQEVV